MKFLEYYKVLHVDIVTFQVNTVYHCVNWYYWYTCKTTKILLLNITAKYVKCYIIFICLSCKYASQYSHVY